MALVDCHAQRKKDAIRISDHEIEEISSDSDDCQL